MYLSYCGVEKNKQYYLQNMVDFDNVLNSVVYDYIFQKVKKMIDNKLGINVYDGVFEKLLSPVNKYIDEKKLEFVTNYNDQIKISETQIKSYFNKRLTGLKNEIRLETENMENIIDSECSNSVLELKEIIIQNKESMEEFNELLVKQNARIKILEEDQRKKDKIFEDNICFFKDEIMKLKDINIKQNINKIENSARKILSKHDQDIEKTKNDLSRINSDVMSNSGIIKRCIERLSILIDDNNLIRKEFLNVHEKVIIQENKIMNFLKKSEQNSFVVDKPGKNRKIIRN